MNIHEQGRRTKTALDIAADRAPVGCQKDASDVRMDKPVIIVIKVLKRR